MNNHVSQGLVYTADVAAMGAVIGSLLDFLPAFAALLAIIWYAIQIWESKTVKDMIGRK